MKIDNTKYNDSKLFLCFITSTIIRIYKTNKSNNNTIENIKETNLKINKGNNKPKNMISNKQKK